MRPSLVLLAAWLWTAAVAAPAVAGQSTPTIATIQVQGNVLSPEDRIIQLTGVAVGAPFDDDTVRSVSDRLNATGQFERVEVLKRFASISDPSRIALVIIVDEGPVKIEEQGSGADRTTRLVRSRGLRLLFLPVLRYDEGYGFSYGVRVARPELAGPGSQLSFPLTWGGDRRAGAQFEQRIGDGALRRIELGGAISHRTNPFYDVGDTRAGFWAQGDLHLIGPVRADVSGGWDHVTFNDIDDRVGRIGGGVTIDTRLDPLLARNAVYARAAWSHLEIHSQGGLNTNLVDLRGYVGLVGSAVLVARVARDDASGVRPPYLKPMLGGTETVRGFRAGSAVGDSLASGSLELRVPVTSPLKIARIGVNLFVDAATVYDEGERMSDQRFERGIGGGVWLSATFLRFTLSVARGLGYGTRVNASTSLGF